MEHSELVQEMVLLEKLTAQDRLKHARQRRQQQLTNWVRRETRIGHKESPLTNGTMTSIPNNRPKQIFVQFPENIVLLEGK
jgi:hypothetical protein